VVTEWDKCGTLSRYAPSSDRVMLRDKWGTLSRRVPQRRRAPAVSRLHDPDLHRRPAGSHALAGVPDKAAQILASIIRYGIVGLVVGWVMSGCAGRQACREHAVPRRCDRARRYCRTDERWRLHFSTGHGSGMRGAFRYARVSVFSPGDAASCVAHVRHVFSLKARREASAGASICEHV
jgi:hypothetical protein